MTRAVAVTAGRASGAASNITADQQQMDQFARRSRG
jgi:hypothetical protein